MIADRRKAACKDNLPLVDKAFDRPGGHHAAILKERYCRHCPIAEECLLEGMDRHEFGVWGMTSPNWRTRHGGPKSPTYVRAQAAA